MNQPRDLAPPFVHAADCGPAPPSSAPNPIAPPQTAIPIDAYADAALVVARDAKSREGSTCDVCDAAIDGEPGGLGLFLSTRGGEVRLEEPVLCATCAAVIGWSAALDSQTEEDEG